jgi:hypothetical protein
MAKARDAAKERFWRRLIRRHVASGLGTRRFCAQEDVPEHQFHWWRRTLRERDRRAADEQDCGQSSGSGDASHAEGNEAEFLPVRLPFSLGTPIEVVHPRGYVHRILVALDAQDAS